MQFNFYKQYTRRLLQLTMGCVALGISVPPDVAFAHGSYGYLAGRSHTAQTTVSGTVIDDSGLPLAAVTVSEKNTNTSTTTDGEGHFQLSVSSSDAILVFSSIGYTPQEIAIGNRQLINVTLEMSVNTLEELVVVGYGTQKKKLTTGATVQVSGEDIAKLSTTNVVNALQSQSPGVQITQASGMPGQGFKVNIRGIGTIGNSQPLYVIDNVIGGDINSLNPSDIESIDILKDAASAAIYGSRAANGVVLVTTKQGKAGKVTLNYDAFVGWQNAYKLPSLLNAKEYMAIQNERRFNEGQAPYDWAYEIPVQYQQIQDGTWNGTNWLEEIHNPNALTQNHAFNLTGGTDRSTFALGYSVASQDGIFGKPVAPHLNRHTVRINSNHVILKTDDFDVLKFGENLTYTYRNNSGIGIGNIYWNDVNNMLKGNPLMPVYNSEGGYYDYASKLADGWRLDGMTANPIADMVYRRGQNESKNHSMMANAYVEIQPIKDLRFRSNFGYRLNASSYRSYTPTFRLSDNSVNDIDDISQNQSVGYGWLLENTVSYQRTVGTGHHFDAVLGQSMERWGLGENLSVTTSNSSFPGSWQHAYVGNWMAFAGFTPTIGGSHDLENNFASFFGRINYNYKETYMATVILRADGSSNFARGHRWGYFPSVSAGWNVSNEAFMESVDWLDFLKLRGSWGQNGNASIDPFQYLATIALDNHNGYYFGNDKNTLITGAYPDILPNEVVSWETSEQLNIGLDARLAQGRLGVVFDWYRKSTIDWLLRAPVLAIFGTDAPFINGGDVENRGFELGLNWNETRGDFTYGINLNGSYNRNRVVRIANNEKLIEGFPNVLSQGTLPMYRAQEGFPIGYFYGYKTAGIFQNDQQIADYRTQGHGVLATAQPGDVIFVDTNGDGAITDADKVQIGNPHPDFTAGLNLSLGYKGIDLSVTAFGAFGHQIAKSYRSFADSPLQNYTTEVFQRWHGEGTSNRYPRLTNGSHTNSQYVSDIYIEDGDFVKIQNITLGYSFKSLFPKLPLGQARLYVSAQNLYTFTGYSGMDPEIGYGDEQGWVSGIDLGFYPSPRNFIIGLNVNF
ncbi:SusC/RagA family TonB-linked outer membrane protein [Parapedobacter pyrenivorans]|uniref:SusC/RagA family TonB-linked outer membrane protein n=1 Tax=Parapedobacter pyrenivorans TaxID=1305674 RepID=A0A917HZG2_9SPHI|nr:TonB-dependent receptor [Parapedobacter pyrenivorans]GGG99582.1 SusC/RagA family TonB-linked outer membrane protein [Parapedobacter pyrenivorans]